MSIARAKRYAELAGQMLEAEVIQARKDGLSWKAIGTELGISAQGANARWGPRIKALDKPNANEAGSGNGLPGTPNHAGSLNGDSTPGTGLTDRGDDVPTDNG